MLQKPHLPQKHKMGNFFKPYRPQIVGLDLQGCPENDPMETARCASPFLFFVEVLASVSQRRHAVLEVRYRRFSCLRPLYCRGLDHYQYCGPIFLLDLHHQIPQSYLRISLANIYIYMYIYNTMYMHKHLKCISKR